MGSYHIIYNSYLRDRVMAAASKAHYNEMNVLSMHALIGAYRPEGQAWVDELVQVLGQNVDWACSYIAEHFEGVRVSKPEGTYMLFLDCTDWCAAHGRDIDWVLREGWRVGVDYQDGRPFHGPCHVRMNLALPFARVKEAFGANAGGRWALRGLSVVTIAPYLPAPPLSGYTCTPEQTYDRPHRAPRRGRR